MQFAMRAKCVWSWQLVSEGFWKS